ncbi:hypothetical protein COO60DRAFT_938927 [Scenedesmus sp. NREL 46B-D3]|nr:hypothetical protein COO60DRAFT_938927 [Scenedesmus sp. NREL 46B-D3]
MCVAFRPTASLVIGIACTVAAMCVQKRKAQQHLHSSSWSGAPFNSNQDACCFCARLSHSVLCCKSAARHTCVALDGAQHTGQIDLPPHTDDASTTNLGLIKHLIEALSSSSSRLCACCDH